MPTTSIDTERPLYFFGDGAAEGGDDQVTLLGGKGAHLHEMTRIGLPVPPGFTITTAVCREYTREGTLPDGLGAALEEAVGRVEAAIDRRLGDPERPLLLSVRSGAPVSMPGMMDTILNIGLGEATIEGLGRLLGSERAAWDSYRRFVQMFGDVVARVDGERFEAIIDDAKRERDAASDLELDADAWREVAAAFLRLFEDETGEPFPTDPMDQLRRSVAAVFDSWSVPRAVKWRRIHGLSDDLGTAANVQAMVFGNAGEDSATGVAFTRDPATGKGPAVGEFLVNAQGEDVVSGTRTPRPLSRAQRDRVRGEGPTLEDLFPEAFEELTGVFETLERHYRDMQDVEFTIERGRLYVLQTRTGKRTAPAMVRIAHDLAAEGVLDRDEALRRLDPARLEQVFHPSIDPAARDGAERLARGTAASPGAAAGRAVFDPDRAEEMASRGETVLLVRRETVADDIGGMHAAEGVLTSRGGATSHAAVVARGMGKPCVTGCDALEIDHAAARFAVGDRIVEEGDWLTIDGTTGEVFEDQLELVPGAPSEAFRTLMGWADERRRLGVRANADTPDDARLAVELGAEGIGLCRTEHMFFDPDRIHLVREVMLLAPELHRRRARQEALRAERESATRQRRAAIDRELAPLEAEIEAIDERYRAALARLLPEQRTDFAELFRALPGRPVTIRLLDPPIHEFLPREDEEIERLARDLDVSADEVRRRIARRAEQNPMLGHRGCRLGVTYPEIYAMQARAVLEAALEVHCDGIPVDPEIMIPLVSSAEELAHVRELVDRVAEEVFGDAPDRPAYRVGTMIESPRAALTAADLAGGAEFFSFGTNDLTQTTFAISRDDAGRFLDAYRRLGLLGDDPFTVLDEAGVGRLIRIAVEEGRAARPDLVVGLCGEHGGEPRSIALAHRVGLDYVSSSPYRLPGARLGAALAAMDETAGGER